MQEKWIQWMPSIQNISAKYYIESLTDNIEGFRVILADSAGNSSKISMSFTNGVSAFRSSEEGFRLSTISYLDKKYGGEFYSDWTFFKVENSEYLKWLSEQSGGISDLYTVKQYSLITDDEILDIVTSYEPTITVLTTNGDKIGYEI